MVCKDIVILLRTVEDQYLKLILKKVNTNILLFSLDTTSQMKVEIAIVIQTMFLVEPTFSSLPKKNLTHFLISQTLLLSKTFKMSSCRKQFYTIMTKVLINGSQE